MSPPSTGIRKEPGKKAGTVVVTFELPSSVQADRVAIVGDFNAWDTGADLLARGPDGVFRRSLTLQADKEYRFRYLLDGERWENDWRADDYWPNEFGGDDSVVRTELDQRD